MEKEELRKCCHDLQNVLTDGELKDINCYELYEELLIFCTIISEETTAFQALSVLKKCCGVLYHSVTSLATLSIEQQITDSLDFSELIAIFAAAKARKKQF
ncbi:unnamed protein product [Macrosiphum euphorbiae]|uniref:Uncharacterized protein n=1 Tax=Macrosiphum euphorbiae TaxID=13131 RepID=A0AAV0WMN7_9HEMI|nr:unnamed protein product [Macrosiphum euphorbiae]